ncbi:MAG: ABC transporter permease, partial [Rhodospirillales bacterium]|nr:ABC transporter permease [Rhodospirillales bacterium]
LSVGFRANVWNIGAEGQLTMGALAGGAVALYFYEMDGFYILPLMVIASVLGGMAWASIPAFLRTRFNANEILTSLMLTYVALLILSYLIHGPMKDPEGMGFPESRLFSDSALLPILIEDTRLHLGWIFALAAVATVWVMFSRHIIGFQIRVIGMAPRAAAFAGFKESKLIWLSFLAAGAAAGVAGLSEIAGPLGQIVPSLSPGYGFTAIIVAFLGRLHPLGILMAALLMALSYLGGENAQITMNMPNAVTGVFQGMLLFFLLGSDVLIKYRLRFGR